MGKEGCLLSLPSDFTLGTTTLSIYDHHAGEFTETGRRIYRAVDGETELQADSEGHEWCEHNQWSLGMHMFDGLHRPLKWCARGALLGYKEAWGGAGELKACV